MCVLESVRQHEFKIYLWSMFDTIYTISYLFTFIAYTCQSWTFKPRKISSCIIFRAHTNKFLFNQIRPKNRPIMCVISIVNQSGNMIINNQPIMFVISTVNQSGNMIINNQPIMFVISTVNQSGNYDWYQQIL